MLKIIPQPQKVIEGDGTFLVKDEISLCGNISENIKQQAENIFLPAVGANVNFTDSLTYGIKFTKDDALALEEYKLDIKSDIILITASSDNGYFYALITLYQLLVAYGKQIPVCFIHDYPRFNYRGFMLDTARYFYSVQDVLHFIDYMALLKLNHFHIHLTDDQGWRLQIDKYPLLTSQGSERSHTNFNHKKHGGYYSKQDIKQIVDYCHDRYIKVIPEIDMPGHMVSAISCYKRLSCFDRDLEVATHFGVKHDILCVSRPSTYTFIKDVLAEVFEMFPDGYVHLGGDEAIKTRWNLCPTCQRKMQQLGVNADELQSVFMNEIALYVQENGYKPMIWNKTCEDKYMGKDVIWSCYQKSDKLDTLYACEANSGRKIISCQEGVYYFDLPYNTTSLKLAYDSEPMFKGITKTENLMGVECDLWTEYVPNMKVAMKKLFPRMFAYAESSWLDGDKKNYDSFLQRMDTAKSIVESIAGYPIASLKQANPSKIRGFFENLWFEKRVFHWEGLHIPLDNAKVELQVKKQLKKDMFKK